MMRDHANRIFDRSPIGMEHWNEHVYYESALQSADCVMICAPIQIKHVHSSVSYQWAIYQKYNPRGRELPSGYGAVKLYGG